MSFRRIFLVSCDYCQEEIRLPWQSISTHMRSFLRSFGWIVTRDNKHFCSRRCYDFYRSKVNDLL